MLALFALASLAAVGTAPQTPPSPEPGRVRSGVIPPAVADASARLSETHRAMIQRILCGETVAPGGAPPCFAEGTDDEVIAAFYAAVALAGGDRYNQVARWGLTALGPAGQPGDPIVLTYSFVPDGTLIPSGAGEAAGPSNLFAALNGIYGSPQVWQDLYAQMFARWSALTGITYVYEPNDDGEPFFAAEGIPGVRGDLRMAGKPIDGFQNIAAYNFYPATGGDMVIDTSDALYTFTGSNSLLLRNVLTHEHGHGMGQNHVCPPNQSKIMEPATPLAFDGPDHDAIRSAQRHYGDPYEPDNSAATATSLGTLSAGESMLIGPTPAPDVPFASVLSIDSNLEHDWFRFSVEGARRVSVTVTPIGLLYDDSDQICPGQTFSCCSGSFTDSRSLANLGVRLVNGDGVTALGTATSQAIGLPETVAGLILPAAGDYFIHVFETNQPVQAQFYHLSIEVLSGPCPGDANGDGEIDFSDLVSVLANWLSVTPTGWGPGDANGDGVADFDDLTEVLDRWLQACP